MATSWAACGRFSIPTDAVPGEALLWNAFRTWKIITQLCDLPPSIQFYVPFWGQIPKIKSNNPLIFNKLNEKASPAFAADCHPTALALITSNTPLTPRYLTGSVGSHTLTYPASRQPPSCSCHRPLTYRPVPDTRTDKTQPGCRTRRSLPPPGRRTPR